MEKAWILLQIIDELKYGCCMYVAVPHKNLTEAEYMSHGTVQWLSKSLVKYLHETATYLRQT